LTSLHGLTSLQNCKSGEEANRSYPRRSLTLRGSVWTVPPPTGRREDIRASRTGRLPRRRAKPTSILLDQDLVEKLRAKGAKRGLGYQTMLKVIVREHLDEY